MQKKSKAAQEAYLTTFGWVRDTTHPEEWYHPSEPRVKGHQPPMGWRIGEAVKIQRINDLFRLLNAEGWQIALGGSQNGYYVQIAKVRSCIGFMGKKGRTTVTLETAFKKQQAIGWSSKVREDPSLWPLVQMFDAS